MRPPGDLRAAPVTLVIAAVTAAAWLLAWAAGWQQDAAILGGFMPARIALGDGGVAVPALLTPLTATLVHSGFAHLALNLLVLLLCGRSLERVLGRLGILLLYLAGAYAAAAAEYAAGPQSLAPMIGAGGAVSAWLGAFALLLGGNKLKIAHSGLGTWLSVLWLGAAWIALQLLVALTFETAGLSFGIFACAGGFLAGLLLARPLLLLKWRGA